MERGQKGRRGRGERAGEEGRKRGREEERRGERGGRMGGRNTGEPSTPRGWWGQAHILTAHPPPHLPPSAGGAPSAHTLTLARHSQLYEAVLSVAGLIALLAFTVVTPRGYVVAGGMIWAHAGIHTPTNTCETEGRETVSKEGEQGRASRELRGDTLQVAKKTDGWLSPWDLQCHRFWKSGRFKTTQHWAWNPMQLGEPDR